MTKSNRRGPKKMGRTRKSRSRRYGGAQAADQAAPNQPQATANVIMVNSVEFELGDNTVLATEYNKLGGTPYTMFGGLATAINGSSTPKHNKIVALLYLIKYHIVADRAGLQEEFQQTLQKINAMPKADCDRINPIVIEIGRQAPFVAMTTDQDKAALDTYVNRILDLLNDRPVVPAPLGANAGPAPPGANAGLVGVL